MYRIGKPEALHRVDTVEGQGTVLLLRSLVKSNTLSCIYIQVRIKASPFVRLLEYKIPKRNDKCQVRKDIL